MVKIVGSLNNESDLKEVQDLIVRPKVHSYDYKSALVDNNKDRLDTLIQYVEGSRVKTIFFRQVLKEHDAVTAHDLTLPPANQQYERIDNLEIRLQSSLSFSRDDEHHQSDIQGTAYILPPIIPNKEDILLMDFGRGTLGKFQITNVQRLSHQLNPVYEVTFKLTHEIYDQINDKFMLDLNKKTISILTWSDNFLQNGQNPLLIPEKAQLFEKLRTNYKRMTKYWFDKFYVRFYQCAPVPQMPALILDGYLMKMIPKWFSSREHQALVSWNLFGMDEVQLLESVSLWDALNAQDEWMLEEAFRSAVVVSTNAFKRYPQFAQASESSFEGLVISGHLRYTNELWAKGDWIVGNSINLPPQPTVQRIGAFDDRPLINQIFMENGYVFSTAFWHNEPEGMSHLELLVRNYISNETVDETVLYHCVEDFRNWGELEQFYLVPVLLLLINYCIRSI